MKKKLMDWVALIIDWPGRVLDRMDVWLDPWEDGYIYGAHARRHVITGAVQWTYYTRNQATAGGAWNTCPESHWNAFKPEAKV